jgi:hypothetical protein
LLRFLVKSEKDYEKVWIVIEASMLYMFQEQCIINWIHIGNVEI